MIRILILGGITGAIGGVAIACGTGEQARRNTKVAKEGRSIVQRKRLDNDLHLQELSREGRSLSGVNLYLADAASSIIDGAEHFPLIAEHASETKSQVDEEEWESMCRSWVQHNKTWDPLGHMSVRPDVFKSGEWLNKIREKRSDHRLQLMKEWYGDFEDDKLPTRRWPARS